MRPKRVTTYEEFCARGRRRMWDDFFYGSIWLAVVLGLAFSELEYRLATDAVETAREAYAVHDHP